MKFNKCLAHRINSDKLPLLLLCSRHRERRKQKNQTKAPTKKSDCRDLPECVISETHEFERNVICQNDALLTFHSHQSAAHGMYKLYLNLNICDLTISYFIQNVNFGETSKNPFATPLCHILGQLIFNYVLLFKRRKRRRKQVSISMRVLLSFSFRGSELSFIGAVVCGSGRSGICEREMCIHLLFQLASLLQPKKNMNRVCIVDAYSGLSSSSGS